MSRVGKSPIVIPSGVQVTLESGRLTGKGPHGSYSCDIPSEISAEISDGKIVLAMLQETTRARALWGTFRSIISGGIGGISKPFERKIDLVGVGYRASVQGNDLVLQLGYSHDVVFPVPSDVKISCEKPTTIVVAGVDKQRVGQVVRQLQAYRKPEPYKGKGLIVQGQFVYRKEGKKK